MVDKFQILLRVILEQLIWPINVSSFNQNLLKNLQKKKSKGWSKNDYQVAPILFEYSRFIFSSQASTNFWFTEDIAIILQKSPTTNMKNTFSAQIIHFTIFRGSTCLFIRLRSFGLMTIGM